MILVRPFKVFLATLVLLGGVSFTGCSGQNTGDNSPTSTSSPNSKGSIVQIPKLEDQLIDTTGMPNNKGFKVEYVYSKAWFDRHVMVWEKCLEDFKGKPNVRYLEIGLFEGRSFFWILENILTDPTCHLTGIDPFLGDYIYAKNDDLKGTFMTNLELSGQQDRCRIITGFSQTELRKLPLDEPFDIIYIDGSHSAKDVLEDGILAMRLLKEGGVLIFDDYKMHLETDKENPDDGVEVFAEFYGDDYEIMHVDLQVFLRKKVKTPDATTTPAATESPAT